MTQEPTWVQGSTARQIHRLQIDSFGGLDGIRDEGMLEFALARPLNLWHCERAPLFQLAAAYAFGIAMNHPFVDGNKRAALVVSILFIELTGFQFNAPEVDAATTFFALAAGDLSEGQVAEWLALWSSMQEGA